MADFKTQAAEYKKYVQGYEAREDRSRPPLPLKVLIEVSSFCNLACVYCATPLNPLSKNMEVETYRRIVTTFRDMDHAARFVLNANGEPFMNPRLTEMLKIDVGPDIVLQVISNGTLLSVRPEKN